VKNEVDETLAIAITIYDEAVELRGILTLPKNAKGIIVFAHGSGSSRLSPRNQYVSHHLEKEGLATLLLDLLTEKEEMIDIMTRQYRFNIPLLANRLDCVTNWLLDHPKTKHLKIAYFGASTGAAAALISATTTKANIYAIVSRGGRPDIALDILPSIKSPTLLIVGSKDTDVIKLNQKALEKLGCIKELKIIDEASHLFEEPGTLQQVAEMSANWFKKHL
jgi:putative phosphoribosyl transferase